MLARLKYKGEINVNIILRIIKQNIIGIVLGVLGLISALLSYFFKGNLDSDMLSYRTFFIIGTIVSIVISLETIIIINTINSREEKEIVNVLSYNQNIDEYIASKSKILNINTIVSIYYSDGDYNVLIGYGIVSSKSENFIQIKIRKYDSRFIQNYKDIFFKIQKNDSNTMKSIIVKNQITNEILDLGGV